MAKQVIAISKDSVSGGVVTLYNDGTFALSIDKAYQKDGRKNLTVYQGTVGVKGFRAMLTVYGDADTIKRFKAGNMTIDEKTEEHREVIGKTVIDI